MDKTEQVFHYLVNSYQEITGSSMTDSELTAHKLMYYAQKTSLALRNDILFEEEFEGWKHGHVLPSLRGVFNFYTPVSNNELNLNETEKHIIENTIYEYGKYAWWTLRNLSHEEISWIKSRKGLSPHDRGNKKIPVSDIMEDAKKVRLYDYVYDQYVDEFEDFSEEDEKYVLS